MAKRKNSCYAVRIGRKPGLYGTWERCKAQVDGYSGAEFQGFTDRQEALDWLQEDDESNVTGSEGDYSDGTDFEGDDSDVTDADDEPPLTARRNVNGPLPFPSTSTRSIIHEVLSTLTPALDFLRTSLHCSPTSSAFYAVAIGRKPGIYGTWIECCRQVNGFSDARYKKFKALSDAIEFMAVYGGDGHFSQFKSEDFEPDSTASFSEEWARLSKSQGWERGTEHYREQRAAALRNEIQTHFFAPPSRQLPAIKQEEQDDAIKQEGQEDADTKPLSELDHQRHEEAVKLHGFQSMCQAVGKPAGDTVAECESILKKTFVNIVDLIDACRAGRDTTRLSWNDFEQFMAYTLSPYQEKTIPAREASKDPILRCFLQDFRRPRGQCGAPRGQCVRRIGQGSLVVKKRPRFEDYDGLEDYGHQDKKIRPS